MGFKTGYFLVAEAETLKNTLAVLNLQHVVLGRTVLFRKDQSSLNSRS